MRSIVTVFGVLLLSAAIAQPASAQQRRRAAAPRRVPDTGMTAVGVQIGAALPNDVALKNGIDLTGTLEHYLSPRTSVRAAVSGAWLDIFGHSFTGTVKPVAVNGNLVYNWEGGAWHPYVTGGIGWYHYRFNENALDSAANKFGIDFGGGAEYFLTRHDTFLGELLVHVVPGDDVIGSLATYQSSYWTLSGGYKKYF